MTRLRTAVLVLLVACGDDDAPAQTRDDAGKPDASATTDARVPVDAQGARDANASDANASDADIRDADTSDAGTHDAGTRDAGSPSLRAQLCGDQTDWPNPLPAMNARMAKVVKDGFKFIEGPVWVRELGELLFSDMDMGGFATQGPPSRIHRLKPPATVDTLQAMSGSNGLALFGPTTVLGATHDTRSLSFFDANSGARTNLAITYDGKRFNSPNDLAVRDDGWVYFSDPSWQLGSRQSELKTAVYRVKLDATTITASAQLIDDTLNQPNGVTLSPDQKTLYVGSSDEDIFAWDVAADGSVSNKRSFAKPGASDGLGVDCAGNLYVTSGGIQVFDKNGTKLGIITGTADRTNVAFGGSASKTLYITGADKLYSIELNVPGFPY